MIHNVANFVQVAYSLVLNSLRDKVGTEIPLNLRKKTAVALPGQKLGWLVGNFFFFFFLTFFFFDAMP